jgi:hypothetical protein
MRIAGKAVRVKGYEFREVERWKDWKDFWSFPSLRVEEGGGRRGKNKNRQQRNSAKH